MPERTQYTVTSSFCQARPKPKCLSPVSHILLFPSSSLHTSCPHTTGSPPGRPLSMGNLLPSLPLSPFSSSRSVQSQNPTELGAAPADSSQVSPASHGCSGGLTVESWLRMTKPLKGRSRAQSLQYPQCHLPQPCRSLAPWGRTESTEVVTGLVEGFR